MSSEYDHALSLEACLSPKMLDLYDLTDKAVVVIDIFRATTTICAALEKGAEAIIPVASIEETFQYKEKGYLVGGERDGQKVDGFDFGNSPREFWDNPIRSETLVLTTTNGTRALNAAQSAKRVFIGSFLNLEILCQKLMQLKEPVLLLCAGWRNHVNLEDTLFAGAVASRLSFETDFIYDAALTAKLLYERKEKDLMSTIKAGSHYQRLLRRGAKKDIPFCLSKNKVNIVPEWGGEHITAKQRIPSSS